MAYVPVPKDLNAVKTKVMFNLTKRQLICFGSGAAVALPLFFLCKSCMNTSVASLIMILVLLPFMLLAMYEKNGRTTSAGKSEPATRIYFLVEQTVSTISSKISSRRSWS